MGRKWKSPRCRMGGEPFTDPKSERHSRGVAIGQKKCPVCRREFFINERHKWPTHGYSKMSFRYGE